MVYPTKLKTLSKIFFLLIAFYIITPIYTSSANSQIQVKLPGFKVTVNGTVVDNFNSRYPLLLYKDITYFPMTFNYANALGLRTEWSQTTGFGVSKITSANASPIIQDLSGFNSLTTAYDAVIPSFKVKVNGKEINNTLEEYPLFVFRDITYFPMTWRFAVTEFGFNTGWNNNDGFSITTNAELLERKTTQEIAKSSASIFLIESYNSKYELMGTGSGFLVDDIGSIVTNYHVIDKAKYITVIDSKQRKYNISQVSNYNVSDDLAILKLDYKLDMPKLVLGDSQTIDLGEDVVTIGSPLGLQNTISNGIVSGLRKNGSKIQITAPITFGSSGGALFNMYGKVIGVTSSGVDGSGNLNFAIPINTVKNLLYNDYKYTLQKVYEYEHMIFYSDATYEGGKLDSKEHGIGEMIWKGESKGHYYYGEWQYGKRTGKGLYMWPNGDQYIGNLLENKHHGTGEYKYNNGDQYIGEWKNNVKDGKGIYTWADGDQLNITWVNGLKHGYGTKIENGVKYNVYYENDKFIRLW
jgi:S1-C subfamily serine protease